MYTYLISSALATLLGGMNYKALACAFKSGLPEEVRQLLRAGSPRPDLDLNQMLTRERAILKDTTFVSSETCLGATVGHGIEHAAAVTHQRCFVCDGLNHLATKVM